MTREIYGVACDMLARREHATHELHQKLAQKGFLADAIKGTLSKLVAENLLNDLRFAQSFLRVRSGQGYGPVVIRQALIARGVTRDVIETAFAESDIDWENQAVHVRVKRFGERAPADIKLLLKQKRFLQYRGFSMESINKLL